MLIFSGGTGTPKLIRGIQEVFEPNQINIVANTADDVWMTNNLVCPDLDTIIYTLKGIIDDDDWWGIKNDTFKTHQFLLQNGFNEYMKIGDKDRAIHLKRTELLEQKNLTQATKQITKQLGIKENVFPMTNDEVNTIITTSDKERHHFQDWWINHSEKEIE
ncbi:2-phospho-L-lactate transferase, partial [archaeon SCG-AAA382B04]